MGLLTGMDSVWHPDSRNDVGQQSAVKTERNKCAFEVNKTAMFSLYYTLLL